ncbi:MAG: class I SAM-dependent methyltransferase [Dehalococcoidia bacterium]
MLDRLTPLKEIGEQQLSYRWAQNAFGTHWRHADLLTTLAAAAYLIQPRTYLEIGVWRGRSTAVVGTMSPTCAIYGFDLWIPDYAGMPNPGPDFVRNELQSMGYRGELTLISGESKRTLPALLREHPELYFDMITIDGDKSIPGAGSDFAHALPRLKIGGVVVCDDVPAFFGSTRVWDRVIRQDRRYVSWEFADRRYGVAAAIRISD